MSAFFEKTVIAGLPLKNRIAVAATGTNLADSEGTIPDYLYDIYRALSLGGCGLLISEMVMVSDHDYPLPGLIRRWEAGDTAPSDCVSCNLCYGMKGHRCSRGTKQPDGTVTKNEVDPSATRLSDRK